MALTFGKCLLRYRRLEAGITQAQLSDRLSRLGLDVSTVMISQYENDHRKMNPVVMRGMCIVLCCQEVDLYEWPR
ncbi:helix-turn-helix domain-containing protein [Paenibacillus sp. NRS-1781]|uniref:helix-turn-helix domain-containing protein n=1 Tax=Paenibacillus sp. NRS-1781 TaxID=3233905 RepID=UPI003D2A3BE4